MHDEDNNNNNNNNSLLLDASSKEQVVTGLNPSPVLAPAPLPAVPGTISVSGSNNNSGSGNGGNGYGSSYRCPTSAPVHPAAASSGVGTTILNPNPQLSKRNNNPTAGTSNTTGGRSGRPPNINENSLQRRLECVLAVEEGMNMVDACAAYDISTRTFYRWLRSKPKLVELTSAAAAAKSPSPSNTNTNLPSTPSRPAKRTRHNVFPTAVPTTVPPTIPPVQEGRTRIEVICHSKHNINNNNIIESEIALNWYDGTSGNDIREAITRRFGLKQHMNWGIKNCADSEEVLISPGMPSGKYFLFFSGND